MKKFLILILIAKLVCMPVFALELDTSVDDQIRKNYNPTKLEDDMALPAMPKILRQENATTLPVKNNIQPPQPTKYANIQQNLPQAAPPVTNSIQNTSQSTNNYCAVLRKGTKFDLKLANNITDRTPSGTKLNFVSTYPVSTTYLTIPSGTVFKGEVLNSHAPQFTGNGGLLVIEVNSMILNGETVPIEGYVTNVNGKYIFFNNIKGKRKYVKSMFASMKPGCHFFGKMLRVSGNLAADGSSIVVAPFSFIIGVLAFGGNVFVSPALALFYKGGPLLIKNGSVIQVKLAQNVFVY